MDKLKDKIKMTNKTKAVICSQFVQGLGRDLW